MYQRPEWTDKDSIESQVGYFFFFFFFRLPEQICTGPETGRSFASFDPLVHLYSSHHFIVLHSSHISDIFSSLDLPSHVVPSTLCIQAPWRTIVISLITKGITSSETATFWLSVYCHSVYITFCSAVLFTRSSWNFRTFKSIVDILSSSLSFATRGY